MINKKAKISIIVALLILTSFLIFILPLINSDNPTNSKKIIEKDFNKNKYQKIDTDYIIFELPKMTTHYWGLNGEDTYEVIISNFSIKNNRDYILKLTWKDQRYISEDIQIHYNFKNGKLQKNDININSLSKYNKHCLEDLSSNLSKNKDECLKSIDNSKLKFKDFYVQLGVIDRYSSDFILDEGCYDLCIGNLRFLKIKGEQCKSECFYNVSYPIYSWQSFPNSGININILDNFLAIDDISVSSCGILNQANNYYILNQSISDNTITDDCIKINSLNITLDCQGYFIKSSKNYTGIYSNSTNTTIKNCNISMGSGGNAEAIGIELTDTADYSNIINNTLTGQMRYGISFLLGLNGPDNSIVGNNTIHENNTIVSGSWITGIALRASSNNTFINNNITNVYRGINIDLNSHNTDITSNNILSLDSEGIYISNSNNNILNKNNITSFSSDSQAVLLDSSHNNILTSNIIIGNSSSKGVMTSDSSNNTLNWNTIISNSSYALGLSNGDNNKIYNQTIIGYSSGSVGVSMYSNSDNNLFQDCLNISGIKNDIELLQTSINNTFLNCSYRNTGINESLTAGSKLIRKWYFDAIVNYTNSTAINSANVSAYNVSNTLQFSVSTNSEGKINTQSLIEYINDGGTRNYYSNYTINASKIGWVTKYFSLNLSDNLFQQFILNDTISPELVRIDLPVSEYYSSNLSLSLNFSVQDLGIGINTCWFFILNSTNGYKISNTTLSNCQNTTFNISDEETFTLYLYANDSYNNINFSSVIFSISTSKPSIILNYPISTSGVLSNSYINNGTNAYFNFTATQSTGLSTCRLYGNWTGSWGINYTWINPTNATMNWTTLNISDGFYKWNIWCNNTLNTENFALNNQTFGIDTVYPVIDITNIVTSTGSQTFTFYYNLTELNSNSCFYSIYNSTGLIDPATIENTTLSCTGTSKIATVSDFATYNLTIYSRDKAGNENSSIKAFTTTSSSGAGGGGASPTKVVEKIIPSNKTYCGDGVCQKQFPGNDLGIVEDFYSCSQDCAGFNIDSTIFYCFDNDNSTSCIWDQLKAQYVGLFMGILIVLLSFTTVEEPKTKRQISLFKYSSRAFKKNNPKLKGYR